MVHIGTFGISENGKKKLQPSPLEQLLKAQAQEADIFTSMVIQEAQNQMFTGKSSKNSNTQSSDGNFAMPKLDDIKLELTPNQLNEIASFKASYAKNKDVYERVGKATNLPPKLIASMHYREGSLDFSKTIKDGNALSSGTKWEQDAISVLSQYDRQGLDYNSTDVTKCLEFAERYNGLGYRNANRPSPYVLAGTKNYNEVGGMYVSDGKFNASTKDKRPGVYALLTHGMNPIMG